MNFTDIGEYSCKTCGTPVSVRDTTCPFCGANLANNRLVRIHVSDTLRLSDSVSGSTSTTIYAPPGAVLTSNQVSFVERLSQKLSGVFSEWQVESVSVNIGVVRVDISRRHQGKM